MSSVARQMNAHAPCERRQSVPSLHVSGVRKHSVRGHTIRCKRVSYADWWPWPWCRLQFQFISRRRRGGLASLVPSVRGTASCAERAPNSHGRGGRGDRSRRRDASRGGRSRGRARGRCRDRHGDGRSRGRACRNRGRHGDGRHTGRRGHGRRAVAAAVAVAAGWAGVVERERAAVAADVAAEVQPAAQLRPKRPKISGENSSKSPFP